MRTIQIFVELPVAYLIHNFGCFPFFLLRIYVCSSGGVGFLLEEIE
jgi:hypothetical protein